TPPSTDVTRQTRNAAPADHAATVVISVTVPGDPPSINRAGSPAGTSNRHAIACAALATSVRCVPTISVAAMPASTETGTLGRTTLRLPAYWKGVRATIGSVDMITAGGSVQSDHGFPVSWRRYAKSDWPAVSTIAKARDAPKAISAHVSQMVSRLRATRRMAPNVAARPCSGRVTYPTRSAARPKVAASTLIIATPTRSSQSSPPRSQATTIALGTDSQNSGKIPDWPGMSQNAHPSGTAKRTNTTTGTASHGLGHTPWTASATSQRSYDPGKPVRRTNAPEKAPRISTPRTTWIAIRLRT